MKLKGCICRIIIPFIRVLPLLLIAGCWSSVELNDITFVRAMVVDKTKSGIELTLDMPLPNRQIPGSAGGTGTPEGKPYTYISQKGKTITEALRKIQADMSREISFGQLRVIVMGKEMAEAGIEPILEFVTRQPSLHLSTILFVTKGNAKELSVIPPVFERFPSDILLGYVTQQVSIATTVKDFLKATYSGGDQIVPLLKFGKKRIESENQKEQAWMGNGGAAIFRQGKMVDTLSMDEMLGGMWIIGKSKETIMNIPSPTDGKDVSFSINNIHTHVKSQIVGDQINLQLSTKAKALVLTSDSMINLKDLQQFKELQLKLNSEVEQQMTKAIDKTREAQADAFNLGALVDWHYPKKWKTIQPNWKKLYSTSVKVTIQANITISGLGTENQPVAEMKKELNEGGAE